MNLGAKYGTLTGKSVSFMRLFQEETQRGAVTSYSRGRSKTYGSVVTHCAAILSGLMKMLLLVCCVQCGASLAKKKNTF